MVGCGVWGDDCEMICDVVHRVILDPVPPKGQSYTPCGFMDETTGTLRYR